MRPGPDRTGTKLRPGVVLAEGEVFKLPPGRVPVDRGQPEFDPVTPPPNSHVARKPVGGWHRSIVPRALPLSRNLPPTRSSRETGRKPQTAPELSSPPAGAELTAGRSRAHRRPEPSSPPASSPSIRRRTGSPGTSKAESTVRRRPRQSEQRRRRETSFQSSAATDSPRPVRGSMRSRSLKRELPSARGYARKSAREWRGRRAGSPTPGSRSGMH